MIAQTIGIEGFAVAALAAGEAHIAFSLTSRPLYGSAAASGAGKHGASRIRARVLNCFRAVMIVFLV